MKAVIYVANRMHLIIVMYVTSLLLAATLFSFFEAKPFWDGMWWSIVTALTIGYGDLAPVTGPGRTVGIVFGHFWVFGVIPMIIVNLIGRMMEDRNRFTHAEQEWHESVLRSICEKLDIKCAPSPPDY
jgi:voltage-gated potassium channel